MNVASPTVIGQVYLQEPHLWPAVVAGAGLLLLLIVVLYSSQLRGVPWLFRLLLPVFRAAALLALLASLMKPVALRLANAVERGSIAVVVDRSRSMSVVDNARTNSERVALADAMGLLKPGARSGAAAGVGAELQRIATLAANVRAAQDDLEFALISGREVEDRRERLRVAVIDYRKAARETATHGGDLAESDELRAAITDLQNAPEARATDAWKRVVPRQIERAREELARFHARFDQHLYESDAQVHEACDQVAKLSRFGLAEAALLRPSSGLVPQLGAGAPVVGYSLAANATPLTLQEQGQPVESLKVTPDGFTTQLSEGLNTVMSAGRTRAVVLFSDGRQTAVDSRTSSGAVPPGVPVFTVNVAAAAPPRDVGFARVFVPNTAFIGDLVPVHAELRHEGIEHTSVEVHLSAAGLADQVRTVELGSSPLARVDFPLDVRKEQAGLLNLKLWITSVPGEATSQNNSVERWIKVMPERMKVAVWAGSPGWDYQEICRIFSGRGEIELSNGVFDGSGPGLRLSADEILQQDVIVLCDLPVAALSPRQWDAVARLVNERGGSVILVAGAAHLPAEYGSNIAASSLLPFGPGLTPRFRVWPGEQPAFRFVPDSDAASLDVLKLSDSATAFRQWQELPPVYRFLQLPNVREGKLRPGARALLVEADSRAPVLLERRQGAGRAFLFCSDETWRWRFKNGGQFQSRFWRQLVHYAAQEPYFASDGVLSLDAERAAVGPNVPVRVRARTLEALPVGSGGYELQIRREGKSFRTQTLWPAGEAGSGRFEGDISLPEGDYLLRLGTGARSVEVPLKVIASDEAEMTDLSADEPFLRQLAESTGGEYFRIDQIAGLRQRVEAVSEARSMYVDIRLWDSPYLFLLVVGCLGMEWALRKQCGLA